MDSSAIVSYMSRSDSEPVKTFSLGYEDDPASSELGYAKIVAQHLRTEHHEFILRSGDFSESLDMLLEHMEELVVERGSRAVSVVEACARARDGHSFRRGRRRDPGWVSALQPYAQSRSYTSLARLLPASLRNALAHAAWA